MLQYITMVLIVQIFFIAFNILSGKYQAYRFDVQHKPISHFAWALMYGALAWGAVIVVHGSLTWPDNFFAALVTRPMLLFYSIVVFRLPVFNTSLNYHRKPRRPLFYTNPIWSKKREQSVLNKLWGKWYPLVFFLCIVLFITLQFFIYG